jgi:hypothetical protein
MKKIINLFTAVLLISATNAQTSKGTWLAGGSLGFTSQSSSGNTASSLTLAPSAGYFVSENTAMGLTVALNSSSGGGTTTTIFAVGPFVRYYFAEIGKKAKLMAQADFATGSGKQTTSGGSSSSATTTGWGISAGPAFFLNKNVALEAVLRYNSLSAQGSSVNSFGVNVGFQIHL